MVDNDYYLKLSPKWWDLEPNERRTLRQKDLFNKWVDMGAKGYIQAVTGFGKTRLGLMAIKRCLEKPNRTVNVIVPHNAAKEVWLGVRKTLGLSSHRMRVCMAQSYFNLDEAERTCSLLILDEGHRFTNELATLFGKVIDKTSNRWVLPLSATFSLEQTQFLTERGIPEVGRVTMREAKECEYVSKHKVWILNEEIPLFDLLQHDKISKEYHNTWSVFRYKMDEIFGCMKGGQGGQAMREFYAQRMQVKPEEIYGIARRAINAMNTRKVFFRKAPCKIEIVKDIVDKFEGKKILTFGEFTDFADELTKAMGSKARSLHSNLEGYTRNEFKYKRYKTQKGRDSFVAKNLGKILNMEVGKDDQGYYARWRVKKRVGVTTLKKESMELFQDRGSGVDILNTSKALDEAADLENVDVAIVYAYTSQVRQLIQRIGRVIRFKKGKMAHIFIVCLTHPENTTQEERWLRDALLELEGFSYITRKNLKRMEYETEIKKKAEET